MPAKYLVAGDHADTLASGRPIAPGDTVPASAVDLETANDQRLLHDGALIDLQQPQDSPDLNSLTRGELNDRAEALGVENASDLPNKDAVIAAINDKENSQ